jgi:flagellar hook protein FlgE
MAVNVLQTGVSGLRTEREAVDVVGDNLANVNTPGFKRQRSGFEDVFMGDPGAGTGAGSRMEDVSQVFTQGTLTQTGNPTDLALNGDGFFVVGGSVNGVTGTFFSRAGTFHFDPSGQLVDPQGLRLMGRSALPDGTLQAAITPLTVPTAALPAQKTSQFDMVLNLDAAHAAQSVPFDPQNPSETATYGSSVQVFDSLGAPHDLDVYFNKLGDNQWEYRVLVDGKDLNPTQPGVNVEVGNGTLTFNGDGALQTLAPTQPISVDFQGAAPGQTIAVDFGTAIDDGGSGLNGATQFGMPSGLSSQGQDGYPSGSLSGVKVGSDGLVQAQFSNGRSLDIGQVQVATFRAPDGLARAGNNLWMDTKASGAAVLGGPGSGGRGSVSEGAIENSNVDIGEEMVSMIQHQRAFSANSKVIAAADDLLSQLMQIKR